MPEEREQAAEFSTEKENGGSPSGLSAKGRRSIRPGLFTGYAKNTEIRLPDLSFRGTLRA